METTQGAQPSHKELDAVIEKYRGKPGELLCMLEDIQNLNPHKYLSKETVRKLILHEDNTIGETVFIKIAECLGFSANEIREIGIKRGYNRIS